MLLEVVLEVLPRPPLTPEVLTVADAELLRIEVVKSVAHVHHILIVEHLVIVEGPEEVVEEMLPVLLADSWASLAAEAAVLLALLLLLLLSLLLLLLLLLLPLLLLLLLQPPHLFHLLGKWRVFAEELVHEVAEAGEGVPGPEVAAPAAMSPLLLSLPGWLRIWLLVFFEAGAGLLLLLRQRPAKLVALDVGIVHVLFLAHRHFWWPVNVGVRCSELR